MRVLLLTALCFLNGVLSAQQTQAFYLYKQNKTHTWESLLAEYQKLANAYPEAKLIEAGKSDCGKAIHLFVIDIHGEFTPEKAEKRNKKVLLINNGIHPGEPAGIDASLKLAADYLSNKSKHAFLQHTILCIIPIYNVDGANNRSCCSRANQLGPEEYGFRGNARNLDLNRDFIKMDAENTGTFVGIFQRWKPSIFVDTHTTNGADYPYTMTLITTQRDKLAKPLGDYLYEKLEPIMYAKMKERNFPMCPYMNTLKKGPDEGIAAFFESPRYSTGYAALFNCIGFVTEAHMLKSFPQRVEATYAFLDELIQVAEREHSQIVKAKREAENYILKAQYMPIKWELDTINTSTFLFKGYEKSYLTSAISGLTVLHYDTSKTWEKPILFVNRYSVTDSVKVPQYYVLPQAWKEVIDALQLNNVQMKALQKDTLIDVQFEYIEHYKTLTNPYEGHYLHYDIKTYTKGTESVQFFKGDYLVSTSQAGKKYLVESLEPRAIDSFFAWNFYDEILQQKEWFSDYLFENSALQLLQDNPELLKELKEKQQSDKSFANSHSQQLYFIYKNSPYYEKHHLRVPVGKIF